MDAYQCLTSRLDVREFDSKPVPTEVKSEVLEAARLSATGMNVQHWRFILIENPDNLRKLAEDSTTGKWVKSANFAVIVLTQPKYSFHMIDAGRAGENMQIAAWSFGVASCVFTGVSIEALRKDFKIPTDLAPSLIIGFGYPARRIVGKKNRKPLREVAFLESFGQDLQALGRT
jgi:nitroreductase